MRLLVTGGVGYLGSHVTDMALRDGHDVMIYDDLSNSTPERANLLRDLGARFREGCILDYEDLCSTVVAFRPDRIIHLAAKKYADESEIVPHTYWQVNVAGTAIVLRAAAAIGHLPIVFSSSSAVYGEGRFSNVTESSGTSPLNVYGETKMVAEELVRAYVREHHSSAIILRYFNLAGGKFPETRVKSLFSAIRCAMLGEGPSELEVCGTSHETLDGTAVRDYIHAEDAARALLINPRSDVCDTFNVGTGTGHSVIEVIEEFESLLGRFVTRRYVGPREGDVAQSVANCDKIRRETSWRPKRTLREMVEDTLKK